MKPLKNRCEVVLDPHNHNEVNGGGNNTATGTFGNSRGLPPGKDLKWAYRSNQLHYDCRNYFPYNKITRNKECHLPFGQNSVNSSPAGPSAPLKCTCYPSREVEPEEQLCRSQGGRSHCGLHHYLGAQRGGIPTTRRYYNTGGHGVQLDRRMNTNGLDRSAMTRSSTNSSDTLPWLAGLNVCQAQQQAHQASRTILSSSTSSADPHLMLPSAPSAAALGGLYRPASLTISELTRHPYPSIYTTTNTTLSPYPTTSLYTYAQPPGVSPGLGPYGMFYSQHYPQHPGFSPSSSTDMQQQSFSQLIARISQHAQPQIPRPFHPSHINPHSYPGQPLTSPTGSPGPSSGPHPPLHPSPIQQLPHSTLFREPRGEGRRLASGSSPLQVEQKPGIHRHSPAQGAHFGLTTKDLPPPTGGPRGDHKDSGLPYSGTKSGADSEYLRQHPGSSSSSASASHRRTLPAHMSSEAISGVKSEEPSSKRPKVGPPPLHPNLPPPPSHTVTSSSPSTAPSLPPLPPLHPASYPSHPHYPQHFMRGSIIQLANGELKRVEDLKTDDFVNSADISADLKIDSSTVVRIKNDEERGTAILSFSVGEQRIQVTVEATLEHPFFVFGRGWSSCNPHRTLRRFGLQCSLLSVGDVCISLTQKETGSSLGPPSTTGALGTSSSSAGTSMTVTVTCRASSPSHDGSDPQTGLISGRHDRKLQAHQMSGWGGPAPVRGSFGKWSSSSRASPEHAQAQATHDRFHKEHLPADTILPQRTPPGSMLSAAAAHGVAGPQQGSAPPGPVRKRRWSAPEQQNSGETPLPPPPPPTSHGSLAPTSTGRLSSQQQEQKDQPAGQSATAATISKSTSSGAGSGDSQSQPPQQQQQQSQYQPARTSESHNRHT